MTNLGFFISVKADLAGKDVPVDMLGDQGLCLSPRGHCDQLAAARCSVVLVIVASASPARVLILRGAGHAAAAGGAPQVASVGQKTSV